MRTLMRVGAILLLLWGIPMSMIAIVMLRNPDLETREAGLSVLTILGVPPMAMGMGLFLGSRQKYVPGQAKRLQQTFFRLLQEDGGCITLLRFSMATGLSGDQAKAYLDQRALEFDAIFTATAQGSVAYVFDVGKLAAPFAPESIEEPQKWSDNPDTTLS